MKTRFDLEQEIMDCWRVVDDLSALNESMLEQNLNADKVSNVLIGLEQLYNIKFDRLFRTLETLIHDGGLK